MNLLITGAFNVNEEQILEFEAHGYKVIFMQNEKDELPCEYSWPEVIICNGLFLTHNIDKFISLKIIQTTSAGLDRIPMEYCETHCIKVYNARGVYSVPMAEFAISGILDIYKHKKEFFIQQNNHQWEKHRDLLELTNKNVLILGCGSVGQAVAKRLKVFDCNLYGIDNSKTNNDLFNTYSLTKLNDLLPSMDIVIVCLPLSRDTYHLFDKDVFACMKDRSILVNISRGALVDTLSLLDALNNKLLGAVIDVFEEEPLGEDSPLWIMSNIVITPHNSFVGEYNNERLFNLFIENLFI